MPKHARYYWGRRQGLIRYEFNWKEIQHDFWVLVSASEGQPPISTAAPQRFIGDARFTVHNIAPFDGGVLFGVEIDFPQPLHLWTDITVFDRNDPTFLPPSRYLDPVG